MGAAHSSPLSSAPPPQGHPNAVESGALNFAKAAPPKPRTLVGAPPAPPATQAGGRRNKSKKNKTKKNKNKTNKRK